MAKIKALSILALLLVSIFASSVSFADVTNDGNLEIFEIKLNDDTLTGVGLESFDFDDKIDLRVSLRSYANFESVKLMAFLTTEYDQDKTMDQTSAFDMTAGVNYRKSLDLQIPDSLDRDAYTLTLMVSDKNGILYTQAFDIFLESDSKHQITIKDVIVTPEVVKAGRQIKVKAKLENIGKDVEDDVKVTASIPELKIADSDYINELEINEVKYSEPIYLVTEKCTEAGTYDLIVKVTYSNGKESVEKRMPIEIASSDACVANTASSEGKLSVALDKESATVVDGVAKYTIALSNSGDSEKTIVLDAESSSIDLKFEPSSAVVLGKDETKLVVLTATPKDDAAAGEHSFVLNVKSGNEKLASKALKVTVSDSNSSSSLRSALEIGLVVVVILLAIIGVLIGFNKLKEDDDEDSNDEEMTSQTYY